MIKSRITNKLRSNINTAPTRKTSSTKIVFSEIINLNTNRKNKQIMTNTRRSQKSLAKSRKNQRNNILVVNKKLESENQSMKKVINENKSSISKNKQNILKLVKEMTFMKLGKSQIHKNITKNCVQKCNVGVERELLKTRMRRYQLQQERKQCLVWENEKRRQLKQLQLMIQQIKRGELLKN